MITRIENSINSILEKLVEKPQNKEMLRHNATSEFAMREGKV